MTKKTISLLMITFIAIIFIGCNSQSDGKNNATKNLVDTSEIQTFTLDDLVLLSNSKFGFLNQNGKIDENYGDFDCTSNEKKQFDFNVGCGHGGDIISVIIKENIDKKNCFDLFIPKGDNYYGKPATEEKKVGAFTIISKEEIKGFIKLCLEDGSACCGEGDGTFILKKLQDFSNEMNNENKISFTIKNSKNLPSWFEKADQTYTLNDDRLVESDAVQFIGGHVPNKGEIFFINNSEILFPENQVKLVKANTMITKTFIAGDYTVIISWDTAVTTGAYSEGNVTLQYKKATCFTSKLIISGW